MVKLYAYDRVDTKAHSNILFGETSQCGASPGNKDITWTREVSVPVGIEESMLKIRPPKLDSRDSLERLAI